MMQYEYSTMQSNDLVSKEQLDELGEEGWMLVQFLHFGPGYAWYFIRVKESQ